MEHKTELPKSKITTKKNVGNKNLQNYISIIILAEDKCNAIMVKGKFKYTEKV